MRGPTRPNGCLNVISHLRTEVHALWFFFFSLKVYLFFAGGEHARHRSSIKMHQAFAACSACIHLPDGTWWKQNWVLYLFKFIVMEDEYMPRCWCLRVFAPNKWVILVGWIILESEYRATLLKWGIWWIFIMFLSFVVWWWKRSLLWWIFTIHPVWG